MEIHVIRHTRLIDGLNKCYGQSDVPVADSFKADAAEIKKATTANLRCNIL